MVYDKVDLDLWLEEYKQRGRAGKEDLWLNKTEFTADLILGAGGLMQRSKMVREYEKVLGLKADKLKPI